MHTKIKEWLKRYLPAELLSTAATILAGIIAFHIAHSYAVMALTATWAGNIFYFGSIFLYDVLITTRQLKQEDKRYSRNTFFKNIRAFIVEFGIAGVLDSFIIRPLLMYYLPILTGNIISGLILAKFVADITFYVPTILSYEFSKKHFRNFML